MPTRMELLVEREDCPFCGGALRTRRAKQCASCKMDWHDPDNPGPLGSVRPAGRQQDAIQQPPAGTAESTPAPEHPARPAAPPPAPEPVPPERASSEILLAAARPDLYRMNAFRVMRVPVSASPREIKRQIERLRMMERFGGTDSGSGTLLPLDGAPDADALREAAQRLQDPERRLMDELFWFWPGQSGDDDEALAILEQKGVQAASDHWMSQELHGSIGGASAARHNLAVLWHALALDLEHAESIEESYRELRDTYWESAFQRWRALAEDEMFWQRLTRRMQELDDPRLTTGTVVRMRATLPLALLMINAQLAHRAAERQSSAEAERHIALMRGSGLPDSLVSDALRRTVEPMRDRVKALCKTAEADADADPEHGNQVTRRLAQQASPILAVLDTLLPEGHPTRAAVRDETALCLLACQIPFGNQTKNWPECVELLGTALEFAASDSVRQRIRNNLGTVESNIELGNCFFCTQSPTDDDSEVEVSMYGNVKTEWVPDGTRMTWNKLTISVPRCVSCRKAHSSVDNATGMAGFLGGLIGVGSCVAWPGEFGDKGCGFAVVTVVLAAVMAGIGSVVANAKFAKGIRPLTDNTEFSVVKERKSQGWELGEGPSQS